MQTKISDGASKFRYAFGDKSTPRGLCYELQAIRHIKESIKIHIMHCYVSLNISLTKSSAVGYHFL